MEIINLKELKQGVLVNGFILIRDVTEKPNKNGGSRVVASASYLGKDVDVVTFNDEQKTELMKPRNENENIIYVEAKVDSYNQNMQLVINKIINKKELPELSSFIKSLDVVKLKHRFKKFLDENMSNDVRNVISEIFQKEELFKRFFEEFAGMKKHDSQIGGLVNHELKMLNILTTLIDNDERLDKYKQQLYFGIVFHDIGKIYEMNRGEYTKLSGYANHIYFGLEILITYKTFIVEELGEDFFYDVVAIVQGHHGKWGERPKTVLAQIVHSIDSLESQVTGLMDCIENSNYNKNDNGNDIISISQDNEWINLMISK